MRIGTWNLAKSGPMKVVRHRQELARWDADVWVFTEPYREQVMEGSHLVAPIGTDAPWVRIESKYETTPLMGAPDAMCVAASVRVDGCEVIVVGSVLPWMGVGHKIEAWNSHGVTGAKLFVAVARRHAAYVNDLQERHRNATVIWAGDFNQHLDGPFYGASKIGRTELVEQLCGLQMEAWNRDCDHLTDTLKAIDLICGPPGIGTAREPFGRGLSDHLGYFVDVALAK